MVIIVKYISLWVASLGKCFHCDCDGEVRALEML